MIEVEVTSGVARGQQIKTTAPFISVGRGLQHTVVVDDPHVSRHHGEIFLLEGVYQYRDLNSTHGTILRRSNVERFIKQVVLREGDELVLGRTDNVIRIAKILPDPIQAAEKSITVMHVTDDQFGPPEHVFANDSKALRSIVQFDSRLMDSTVTTDRQALDVLIQHIPEFFDELDYVAIIEYQDDETYPYEYTVLRENAQVRLSTNIIKTAAKSQRAFLFTIGHKGILRTGTEEVALSHESRFDGRGAEEETSGICAPLCLRHGKARYLQFERRQDCGLLTHEDLAMVNSLVSRVADHVENLELVRRNQLLNVNASLGVFAAMIGHDIKNYLFFEKSLSDIRDDPLSKHIGIISGIERARRLAQGMKELAAPGHLALKTFSVERLVQSIVAEFNSLFGERCGFEAKIEAYMAPITTSEELLSRVMWNLVMNAYHSAENLRNALTASPWVHITISDENDAGFAIEIRDNAGGVGPRTLEYIQRSFQLIKQIYTHEEEVINVVEVISRMEGFTNSVGLFFTAVAVNDMDGDISVTSVRRKGSVFRIRLPKHITELKRLLRF
jgi:signal transduction histidine kinase